MKKLMRNIAATLGLTLLSVANVVSAQTYLNQTSTGTDVASTTSTGVVTPGVPSTGAGGAAGFNLLILGLSLAVILFGIYYLNKKPASYSDLDLS